MCSSRHHRQRRRPDTLWENEKTINRDLLDQDPARTGIPVFFNIPYDLPPTSEDPEHIWKLKVEADVQGIDYLAEFHVPVFKTEANSPNAKPVDDPTASFQPHGGEFRWPEDSPIHVGPEGGAFSVHFPAARNKGFLAGFSVFQAIWIGAVWFMIEMEAPLFFPIVFGFVGATMLLSLMHMLLHSVRIRADNDGLQIERRWLILRTHQRLAASDALRVAAQSNMSSGDNNFYCIKATTSGNETTLAGGIPDKRQADWLAEQISDHLGIPPNQ